MRQLTGRNGSGEIQSADAGRPRVLYVSAVAEMKGGAEAVLLDMVRSPFVQAALAVPGPGALADCATAAGVPVHFYSLGHVSAVQRPLQLGQVLRVGRDTLLLARQLADLARGTKADLVHANGLKVHVGACLARLLHGTRSVIHMHDVPFSRSEQVIWSVLHSLAGHTIAASSICFPQHDGRSSRISLLRQGVNMEAALQRRTLPARPVIGFLGRFHRFKGTHLLLDWFEAAAEEFPAAKLLLRGRVDPEGEAYWAALQPQIERLVSAGRCRVEEWRGAEADPFHEIDILVAPSVHPEVGPRVIMEAMLRGIPAIGYPAGGALEMIPDPSLGAHAAGAEQFRDALRRLLCPTAYEAVSAAALEHARRHFGIDRFWKDLAQAHATALAGPRPAHSITTDERRRSPILHHWRSGA
ncbi:glycosyltransferase family 4 protein [Roseomonas harenae]|jgi:glycosyltransferase involved in cell wall biosynthesis|uniref:glycosyltransferase family 4 protein n=1 Tax=Muricoccus harenae TaxID=2692566 RepID=UPI00133175BC|nr:glycosyltransferase family 4 protein [Roseomonas harenae]